MPKCPNCGKEATFTEHSADCVEPHGLDCGPYERWTETWLTCSECHANTDDAELAACNQDDEPRSDDPADNDAEVTFMSNLPNWCWS
jgi:hypothetical protein